MPEVPVTVPWITASKWTAADEKFSVTADLSDVIKQHGKGVYTVFLWGNMEDGEMDPISEYSIFHGVTPPGTYYAY
jgi:hypothetical protein